MPIDITDPQTAAKLAAARETGYVYGPDGFLLGKFVPVAVEPPVVEDEPSYDDMERLINDPNTKMCTPEEVIARLREIDRCGR
ncbi:MAG: hypothetical protein K2X87_05405 [Gemmataceae bacterium]|nr:hypothetical protein [Gemmataceae bacterium]